VIIVGTKHDEFECKNRTVKQKVIVTEVLVMIVTDGGSAILMAAAACLLYAIAYCSSLAN